MKTFLQRNLARFFLMITGWRLEGVIPEVQKCVIIGAPHTSNWDFFFGMLYKLYYGLNMHFLMKKELFLFPFRWVFRWIGGIPVDRKKRYNLVEQLGEKMKHSTSFYLAIAPEGTRREVMVWKRGFYHIAKTAGVPIILGYMDYRRKVVGVGPVFYPGADIESDMKEIIGFYADIQARYPGNFYLPLDRQEGLRKILKPLESEPRKARRQDAAPRGRSRRKSGGGRKFRGRKS
jgi:1-acyl-sn-glycerol-3-phosphate acyltransferase